VGKYRLVYLVVSKHFFFFAADSPRESARIHIFSDGYMTLEEKKNMQAYSNLDPGKSPGNSFLCYILTRNQWWQSFTMPRMQL
jgi:hypothetical protein